MDKKLINATNNQCKNKRKKGNRVDHKHYLRNHINNSGDSDSKYNLEISNNFRVHYRWGIGG